MDTLSELTITMMHAKKLGAEIKTNLELALAALCQVRR